MPFLKALGIGCIFIVVLLLLFALIHFVSHWLSVIHIWRFGERQGVSISRMRSRWGWQTVDRNWFTPKYTLVELDCLDGQQRRRLVLLLVWPFGIHKVLLNEIYPESYDREWPLK